MSNNPAQLLKSDNPADRKKGVQLVAKMENEKALRVLMKIYKQDPDDEVRAIAKEMAVPLAKKLREETKQEQPASVVDETDDYEPELPPDSVEVSERTKAKAKGYLDEAMDHQINDDRPKAMRALTKALDTNPNLAKDPFFKSVAASVMAVDAEEAVHMLLNADKRKGIVEQDRQRKTDRANAEHMEIARRHTWATLSIDIALLAAISFLVGFLSIMVLDYTAAANVNSINRQLNGVVDEETGEQVREPEDDREVRERLTERRDVTNDIAEGASAFLGLLVGAGMLATILPNAVLQGVVVQPIATRMLKGEGTMAFAVYNIINAYIIPMIVMGAAFILICIIVFLVGAPLIIAVFGIPGVISLVSLILTLRIWAAVGKTYKIGLANGIIAIIIASIPVSIVISFIGGVIGGIIMATAATLFEAFSSAI